MLLKNPKEKILFFTSSSYCSHKFAGRMRCLGVLSEFPLQRVRHKMIIATLIYSWCCDMPITSMKAVFSSQHSTISHANFHCINILLSYAKIITENKLTLWAVFASLLPEVSREISLKNSYLETKVWELTLSHRLLLLRKISEFSMMSLDFIWKTLA